LGTDLAASGVALMPVVAEVPVGPEGVDESPQPKATVTSKQGKNRKTRNEFIASCEQS